MMKHLLACLAAGLLILVTLNTASAASQTGDIRGYVFGPGGQAVAEARVMVLGGSLLGSRAVQSNSEGQFRFLALPPGTYELKVEKEGFRSEVRRGVRVNLDRTTTLRFELALPTTEETVEVTETLRVIDTTESAISESVGVDYFTNLPVGRSFQDVIRTLPGISGRIDYETGGESAGNPSVRGEGQYGNNFLLDGFSTRDPATHTFGSNVNFDAIQEITVFTDGAPAEYGDATGMIANVVSKSGTNEFHGSIGTVLNTSLSCIPYDFMGKGTGQYNPETDTYETVGGEEAPKCATYSILNTSAGKEVETPKRRLFSWAINGTLGGPIVKDKLHFFFALDYGRGWNQNEGAPLLDDPETEEVDLNPLRQKSVSHNMLAKLTWSPISSVNINYSYINNARDILNYADDPLVQPEAQTNYESSSQVHNVNGRFFLSDTLVLEAKYLRSRGSIDVVPASGNTSDPSYHDIVTGEYYGNADASDLNSRNRDGISVNLSKFFQKALGDHEVKIGLEYHHQQSARELKYSGDVTYTTAEGVGPDGIPGNDDDALPIQYTEYTYVGDLSHDGYNLVIFGQDSWNPVPFLTVNYGLRVEQIRLLQNEGFEVVNQWYAAPRFGIAWDITRDGKTQLAFSAGRYYDANAVDFAGWADTRSAFAYTEYTYNVASGGYDVTWIQDPVSDAANFDPELVPYHADRMTLSVRRELFKDFAMGLRGVYSKTTDIPEDVMTYIDTDFNIEYEITNPSIKQRQYWGIELTAEKKLSNGWQLLASYTYSQAKGTTPGNFETASGGSFGSDGNEVGVFLDNPGSSAVRDGLMGSADSAWILDGLDGLGYWYKDPESGEITYNLQGWYGYLPYHSFHNIKVNASYTFPWQTTVGLVAELDSGHAWQKRGYVWLYGDYYAFPEGRGSRSMPPVFYLDLHLGQVIPLKKSELEITLDFFNLLDLQAPITYYENDDSMLGLTMFRQPPRSVQAQVHWSF